MYRQEYMYVFIIISDVYHQYFYITYSCIMTLHIHDMNIIYIMIYTKLQNTPYEIHEQLTCMYDTIIVKKSENEDNCILN